MYDTDERKLLSALCYGTIFFSTAFVLIVIPIFILFVSNDSVVRENAKESINCHLNVWVYGFILFVLSAISWGQLLFPLTLPYYLIHCGLTIWALFHVLGNDVSTAFRYPFIFRIF
jgi:uncharacterized protein